MRSSFNKSFQAEALVGELMQERRDLSSRIRADQEEMKHAYELIHKVENRIKQGTIYVTKTISEYDRGFKNGPDVLGVLQRQVGFRKRLVELQVNYQIAKSDLLQSLGQ